MIDRAVDYATSCPRGWSCATLSELFVPVPKAERQVEVQDGTTYQLLTVRLYARGVVARSQVLGEHVGTKRLYRTEQNDFIFSKIDARNGAWGFVPKDLSGGVVSNDFPILRLSGNADKDFLAFCLSRPAMWVPLRDIAVGTTNRRRIQIPELLRVRVLLPPLPEQRAIARVLSTVQRAREATEAVIAATRELKRSLMRHLFTYGPVPVQEAGQVPLKETEIGPVPEHWRTATLGHLACIGNGSTPKRSNPLYWDGGTLPWLTSGKVHDVIIQQADEFVTPLAQRECHLPMVKSGSLLVAITGQGKTLGNVAMVTFDTCISQHLAYVQFKDTSVDAEFMLRFLQSRYLHFRQVASSGGTTKGALTCAFLRQYVVPLPPVNEQRHIASILRCLDTKLRAEESRKQALDALFRSLLHHLMTGRIRVDPEQVLAGEP